MLNLDYNQLYEMNFEVGALHWNHIKAILDLAKLRGNITGYVTTGWISRDLVITGAVPDFVEYIHDLIEEHNRL